LIFTTIALMGVMTTGEVFARGGGRSSAVRSGAYGSVRQSSLQASSSAAARGVTVAAAGDNRAGYERQVTGAGGKTATSSGNAVYNDGKAAWTREVTGPGGKSATVTGAGTAGDGEAKATRQVTGPNGRTATTQREAERVGSTVTVLPAEHFTTQVGTTTYYYHEGAYYQPVYVNDTCTYTVVPPPLGVVVYQLPAGAVAREVGGTNYFTVGGAWYKPAYMNGVVSYTVVASPE
jgi:hypothetical protein